MAVFFDGCYASGEMGEGWGPSWKLASLAQLRQSFPACDGMHVGRGWTKVVKGGRAMPIVDKVSPPAPCRVQS